MTDIPSPREEIAKDHLYSITLGAMEERAKLEMDDPFLPAMRYQVVVVASYQKLQDGKWEEYMHGKHARDVGTVSELLALEDRDKYLAGIADSIADTFRRDREISRVVPVNWALLSVPLFE